MGTTGMVTVKTQVRIKVWVAVVCLRVSSVANLYFNIRFIGFMFLVA
jgi:hypothetical protein